MKENLEKEYNIQLPDGAIEFSDSFGFLTYLSGVRGFYDTYVKPTEGYGREQNRLQEFYGGLKYFNDTILIPETNEVLFQLDTHGRVIAFILFGKRFSDDEHVTLLCVSVHTDHQNQGRAKSLLELMIKRIKDICISDINPGEPIYQHFDRGNTGKWALCINRILQNSGLTIID